MLFSSIPFLYYFLPLVLAVYFLVPRGLKNAVLFASSLLFYAWGEPRFCLFMLLSILQGYVFGRLIEKNAENRKWSKIFLTASVLLSLGLLGYCKYADFFISSLNAVTGLSLKLLHVAHQLLYVPDPELRCRCVPKGRSRAEKLLEARHVYCDVPAAHCGSHRALRRDRAAAGRAGDDTRGRFSGRGPVRDRTVQKSFACKCAL